MLQYNYIESVHDDTIPSSINIAGISIICKWIYVVQIVTYGRTEAACLK